MPKEAYTIISEGCGNPIKCPVYGGCLIKSEFFYSERNHWWELCHHEEFQNQLGYWKPLVQTPDPLPRQKLSKINLIMNCCPRGDVLKLGTCVLTFPFSRGTVALDRGTRHPLWVRKASFRKAPTLAPVTQVIKVIHFPVSKSSKQHIQRTMGGGRWTLSLPCSSFSGAIRNT